MNVAVLTSCFCCAERLSALKVAQRRHAIYHGFATDPDAFVRGLLAASAREMRELPSAAAGGGTRGHIPPAEHFALDWAKEAAMKYLEPRGPPRAA